MLQFFRNYQRIFFLIITGVIVVTFSFFGTSPSTPVRHNESFDKTAFTLLDGTQVSRGEVEQMVRFIATDAQDKWQHGGARGLNGLNDGAIRKDFFESGLATIILSQHADLLAEDLAARAKREKRMKTYSHPQAKFLSAESAWSQYAPDLKRSLDELRAVDSTKTQEAFEARIATYLAEKKFPQQMLKQVLQYQQQQTRWIAPDPTLIQQDLSLFGYRTLEDWFGRKFLHVAAQTIYHLSSVASEKGYEVTDEEVRSDLMQIAAHSYRQGNGAGGGVNGFYKSQLRDLEMTERGVMKLWRHVLLARRLMHDVGTSVFVDNSSYQQFMNFAAEKFETEIYEMPPLVRLHNLEDLLELDLYLEGVAGSSGELSLELPVEYHTPSEIKPFYPELIARQYKIAFVEVDQGELQRGVPVQSMWDWELGHWNELITEFPEVADHTPDSKDERFDLLEQLDTAVRAKVDRWARVAMVKEHPEWIAEALAEAETTEADVSILYKGGSLPFKGMDDREALMEALTQDELSSYTQDGIHFYNLRVLDRSAEPEVLTFVQARQHGALRERLQADLEQYYDKIRYGFSSDFQTDSGEWKPFAEVRARVLEERCARLVRKVRQSMRTLADKADLTPHQIAAYRYVTHLENVRQQVINANLEPSRGRLAQQWDPVKTSKDLRRDQELRIDIDEVANLSVGKWSDMMVTADGQSLFLRVNARVKGNESITPIVEEGQRLLGEGAKRQLMAELAERIRQNTLVSLDYLGGA